MKWLLDTQVLAAASLSRGACHELLEYCALNHEVVASEHILEALGRTLERKARIPGSRVAEAPALLMTRFTLVPSAPLGTAVSRDADDDLALSAA